MHRALRYLLSAFWGAECSIHRSEVDAANALAEMRQNESRQWQRQCGMHHRSRRDAALQCAPALAAEVLSGFSQRALARHTEIIMPQLLTPVRAASASSTAFIMASSAASSAAGSSTAATPAQPHFLRFQPAKSVSPRLAGEGRVPPHLLMPADVACVTGYNLRCVDPFSRSLLLFGRVRCLRRSVASYM